MTPTFHLGLPADQRQAAVRLYWQAFGGKLGRVMGPEPRALAFLERVMRADHVIVALDPEGQLLGMAGFKTPQGSFAGGGMADLRAVYGPVGAMWRGALLQLLSREIDNERFLLDGICVVEQARSMGLGAALLAEICTLAKARGYSSVRLDVVDINRRARSLYEREGFVAVKTDRLGPLRFVFGFASSTTMVRTLD